VFASFDETLGALNCEQGNASVFFAVTVVRAGEHFDLGERALEISDLLGAFVDEKNHEVHFLVVVFLESFCDVMEESGAIRSITRVVVRVGEVSRVSFLSGLIAVSSSK
jgi:hypothetical protein